MEPSLDLLARITQCTRCRGRRFNASGDGLTCVACGNALATIDGVLQAPRDGEDDAIDRERRAVLDLEQVGATGPFDFSFDRLLAGAGPLRTAFLSLPYDDGSAFFREAEYFRNVSQFASTFDAVVSRLPLPTGSVVVDVGADLTWSTARLAARGWQAVAIDINHHLVASRVFRERGLAFAAVNVDMHAPLFADGVLDAVTAFNAMHHTHRLDALVENLARTLKPGGYLAFIEPYWVHEHNRATFGESQIEAGINENVYRLEEWHRTFITHGLEPVMATAGRSFHGLYRKGDTPAARRSLSLDRARDDFFSRGYRGTLSGPADVIAVEANTAVEIPIVVSNHSHAGWTSDSQIPIFLSYHLRRIDPSDAEASSRLVAFDNPRTALAGTLYPGDTAVVPLRVTAPDAPGDYALDVDLVQEGMTWFADRGMAPTTVALRVIARQD